MAAGSRRGCACVRVREWGGWVGEWDGWKAKPESARAPPRRRNAPALSVVNFGGANAAAGSAAPAANCTAMSASRASRFAHGGVSPRFLFSSPSGVIGREARKTGTRLRFFFPGVAALRAGAFSRSRSRFFVARIAFCVALSFFASSSSCSRFALRSRVAAALSARNCFFFCASAIFSCSCFALRCATAAAFYSIVRKRVQRGGRRRREEGAR